MSRSVHDYDPVGISRTVKVTGAYALCFCVASRAAALKFVTMLFFKRRWAYQRSPDAILLFAGKLAKICLLGDGQGHTLLVFFQFLAQLIYAVTKGSGRIV